MMILPCPECCDDPPQDNCIIDTDDFSGTLDNWTQNSGSWSITAGRMGIVGAGRITNESVADTENDSVKVLATVRCTTSTGTALITLVENDDGERLAVELTRDGDCLTFRLATRDASNTTYLTEAVAQFSTTNQDQNFSICWQQGPAIDGGGASGQSTAAAGTFTPDDPGAWTDEEAATGAADEVTADGHFDLATSSLGVTFTGFVFDVPAGSLITGITVTIRAGTADDIEYSVIRVTDGNGTPVGDDKGTNQAVSNPALGNETVGGTTDDWNAGLTGDDVQPGTAFAVLVTFTRATAGVKDVFVDACTVSINYTSPERRQGTLTATCAPDSFPSSDGYDADSLSMAVAKTYAQGTRAGFTVIDGTWDFDDFKYYYERTTLYYCPTCPTQCFIFGDTFHRSSLGCHYEVISGTWTPSSGTDTLTVDATGEIILLHIPTEDGNPQYVRVTVTLDSDADEARIKFGCNAAGTGHYAKFSYNTVSNKWFIDIYDDAAALLDSAELSVSPDPTFPYTTDLTLCLIGTAVFASSTELDIETTLADDLDDPYIGLYGTTGVVFEDLRFHQTPTENGIGTHDCPPCGGIGTCTICEGEDAPQYLMLDLRGMSSSGAVNCPVCTAFNGSFLLQLTGVDIFNGAVSCDGSIQNATYCVWSIGLGTTTTGCFASGGSGFRIEALLVRDDDTNDYWLVVIAGGPSSTDPTYGEPDVVMMFRKYLGKFDELPDCFDILEEESLDFACDLTASAVFDCDPSTVSGSIAAV